MNKTTETSNPQSVSGSVPKRKNISWYRGLWRNIWLSIIGAIAVYGLCTGLYFYFIITPRMEAHRQELQAEREQQRQEFRQFISSEKESYYQRLIEWRNNTPEGTPPPVYEFKRPEHLTNNDHKERPANPINPGVWFLIMVAIMGAATYPVARKLTQRLEKLQKGVEDFGSGHLQARVAVSGNDEVTLLAQSFNASAKHIESLVQQHKQLLAQVSHELRTPLARLRMSTELAATQVPEIAQDLRTDIKELDNLVGEILLASRLDAVPDILQISSFDALALAAEEAARTCAELEGQSVEIQADEQLIRRALRNLLANAERYAPDSPAKMTVSLEPASDIRGPQVCFTLTDQGPGISPQDRQHIFEPFFRTRQAKAIPGGTGLGLSLVQQIALRHGGAVVCKTPESGKGCQFELRIPTQAQAKGANRS